MKLAIFIGTAIGSLISVLVFGTNSAISIGIFGGAIMTLGLVTLGEKLQ